MTRADLLTGASDLAIAASVQTPLIILHQTNGQVAEACRWGDPDRSPADDIRWWREQLMTRWPYGNGGIIR